MKDKVVLFLNEENSISILVPSEEALAIKTLEEIANNALPPGTRYGIADRSELPNCPPESWEIDPQEFDKQVPDKLEEVSEEQFVVIEEN